MDRTTLKYMTDAVDRKFNLIYYERETDAGANPPFKNVFPYDYDQVIKPLIELSKFIEDNYRPENFYYFLKYINKTFFEPQEYSLNHHLLWGSVPMSYYLEKIKRVIDPENKGIITNYGTHLYNQYIRRSAVWGAKLSNCFNVIFSMLCEVTSYYLFCKKRKDYDANDAFSLRGLFRIMRSLLKNLILHLNYKNLTYVNADLIVMTLCNILLIFQDTEKAEKFIESLDDINFDNGPSITSCSRFPYFFKYCDLDQTTDANRPMYFETMKLYINRIILNNKRNRSHYAIFLHLLNYSELNYDEKLRMLFEEIETQHTDLLKRLIESYELNCGGINAFADLLFPLVFRNVQLENGTVLSGEDKRRVCGVYLNQSVRDPNVALTTYFSIRESEQQTLLKEMEERARLRDLEEAARLKELEEQQVNSTNMEQESMQWDSTCEATGPSSRTTYEEESWD